jgi:hypothetical protein
LDRCSIPSREVSILWSYLDITLLFSSYVYLIFLQKLGPSLCDLLISALKMIRYTKKWENNNVSREERTIQLPSTVLTNQPPLKTHRRKEHCAVCRGVGGWTDGSWLWSYFVSENIIIMSLPSSTPLIGRPHLRACRGQGTWGKRGKR